MPEAKLHRQTNHTHRLVVHACLNFWRYCPQLRGHSPRQLLHLPLVHVQRSAAVILQLKTRDYSALCTICYRETGTVRKRSQIYLISLLDTDPRTHLKLNVVFTLRKSGGLVRTRVFRAAACKLQTCYRKRNCKNNYTELDPRYGGMKPVFCRQILTRTYASVW